MFGGGRAAALIYVNRRLGLPPHLVWFALSPPLCSAAPSTVTCSGLPVPRGPAHPCRMGTKSRETIYGASVRAAAERATEARKQADRFAVEAWNKRMLGFQGPAQPSPTLGDAINAGYGYLAS